MRQTQTLPLILLTSAVLIGCGDTLVDAQYRGVSLFDVTGTIAPASEVAVATVECGFEEAVCVDGCAALIAEGEWDDTVDETRAYDECVDDCFSAHAACIASEEVDGVSEAYYSSEISQRIGVIWANPAPRQTESGRRSESVLMQRSLTSTGLPARYRFSIYQPPPERALHESADGRYAIGLITTFYDRDNNERLNLTHESLIGFNLSHGVIYMTSPVTTEDGQTIPSGYHMVPLDWTCSIAESVRPNLESEPDATTMSVTGSATYIFDYVPDLGCDSDLREWLELCDAPSIYNRCNDESPPERLESLCSFCRGDQESPRE